MKRSYSKPDQFADVYSFAPSEEIAHAIADEANRTGMTRVGKFVPGTFRVVFPDGRTPAVIGQLSGQWKPWR